MTVYRAVCRGLRALIRPSPTRLDSWMRAFSYADLGYAAMWPGPRALTDEQLRTGWRATSATLRQEISTARRLATVDEREWYLDELERRNPSGFEAWLRSGSQDPEDLMPHLRRVEKNAGP
jgi:hypothetical protein